MPTALLVTALLAAGCSLARPEDAGQAAVPCAPGPAQFTLDTDLSQTLAVAPLAGAAERGALVAYADRAGTAVLELLCPEGARLRIEHPFAEIVSLAGDPAGGAWVVGRQQDGPVAAYRVHLRALPDGGLSLRVSPQPLPLPGLRRVVPSPGGRWLAVEAAEGIFVVPRAGGEPTLVERADLRDPDGPDARVPARPVWSPGGLRLAYAIGGNERGFGTGVYEVRSGERRVFEAREGDATGDLLWLDDERLIVQSVPYAELGRLYHVDARNGQIGPLAGVDSPVVAASLSPDGRRLAVVAAPSSDISLSEAWLAVHDLPGERTMVRQDVAVAGAFRVDWLDGSRVVIWRFVSDASGNRVEGRIEEVP